MMTNDYADNGVGFATSVGRVSWSRVRLKVGLAVVPEGHQTLAGGVNHRDQIVSSSRPEGTLDWALAELVRRSCQSAACSGSPPGG